MVDKSVLIHLSIDNFLDKIWFSCLSLVMVRHNLIRI